MDLIQVANNIVLKKSVKNVQFCAKFKLNIAQIQVFHGFEKLCKN